MNTSYLSLGSNQKFPERQLRSAIKALKKLPRTNVIKISSLYWTKPWGLTVQQDFCNAVVKLTTTLDPLSLLKHCQLIEIKLGRIRKRRWGPRVIDIDIILFENVLINTEKLTIPHPLFKLRDFVLMPLEEITSNDFIRSLKST
ncbi:2-amino-4-hydroxy-6-hydroxymethyldihydropteridine diphosphokinase [Legionella waltersii]|uniref:2-amino-4-hydroxy-6-hydroxymethyldihydropteridine pyrophosphokinase n=1 Tax=Legionella waltersii TaxID=66969 RepID=A0A0W1A219_9GAMM|nr:2-amino-4-hydroxy-6-hydroxymethyldihydropteridine diphosphokinase [Legionella waltersii]KTD75059.1 2-amino-4-hydroxy-6- hydroxymethyldihydropteridine pyrophosphokinase [Legionella waltersii]SNV05335.1 2-amino-4-hydroxy-6-hydroxymethyldihydropteridinepyrophosphokinase [Legionella waltersii]